MTLVTDASSAVDAALDAADEASAAPVTTIYEPALPVDLRATLAPIGRGPYDPTTQWSGAGVWRTFHTPSGPATLHLEQSRVGAPVRARAWGPGAEWAIDGVPQLLGRDDDWSQLDVAAHPFLVETLRRNPGLRLPTTRRVFEALCPAILEQKVTSLEAYRSWAALVTRLGHRAPGAAIEPRMPARLRLAPTAAEWRFVPSWEWHRAGVDPTRSRTLVEAAARAAAIDRVTRADALTSLRGVGVWTAAEAMQRSHGDPDQVSVGDYHVPHFVGHALAGDRNCDDDGMLELLAPWVGQRQRVVRLILASGRLPERRGPRATITDHRWR
ncbi:DNA-3-methyladenine glycosylase family protein [Gryllotalpicola reticulitermitis]|uniref:DNA-3-methyladenine glycosylase family protein n=1 Tax=Gryllotalpicola reticulitermitis TaxID=1184153 RepID=A0ABV8Q915_9MICO